MTRGACAGHAMTRLAMTRLGGIPLWLVSGLALIAGCAPIPQGTTVPGRPVTSGAAATRGGAAAPAQVAHAPVDSLPSPDALQVLATDRKSVV